MQRKINSPSRWLSPLSRRDIAGIAQRFNVGEGSQTGPIPEGTPEIRSYHIVSLRLIGGLILSSAFLLLSGCGRDASSSGAKSPDANSAAPSPRPKYAPSAASANQPATNATAMV